MKILLICAGGLSTSILVSKMKTYAQSIGDDVLIEAHPAGNLAELIERFDIVLLGPQINHKLESIKKQYGHLEKPIQVIESMDYGLVRGKEVYEKAKKTLSLRKG